MSHVDERMREKVVEVVRRSAERLASDRPDAVDEAARARALEEACADVGIARDEYDASLRADADLAELARHAMTEAVAGSTDPGPHGGISRESPSGQPGDLTKSRTNSAP